MNSYTGRRLCHELAATIARGGVAALATVVRTEGSTYRKAGARMLVHPAGDSLGLVSGGCLEDEIAATGRAVMVSGEPRLLHFDLTDAEEAVLGYGKGCFGASWILVEPITPAVAVPSTLQQRRQASRLAAHASLCAATAGARIALVYQIDADPKAALAAGRAGGAATLLTTAAGPRPGDRVVLDAAGVWRSTWDDGDPAAQALAAALEQAVPGGQAVDGVISSAGGVVRYCIYEQFAPRGLLLFGGGPDAVPVCHLAASLGWDVHVCEHRPARLESGRFPEATAVHGYNPDAIDRGLPPQALRVATACVIMTHNLMVDARALVWAAQKPQLRYVGLLGPRHRRDRLFALVDAEAALAGPDGVVAAAAFDSAALRTALGSRLRSPIGLDLGGHTEHDIALAIVAQLQRDSHAAAARVTGSTTRRADRTTDGARRERGQAGTPR